MMDEFWLESLLARVTLALIQTSHETTSYLNIGSYNCKFDWGLVCKTSEDTLLSASAIWTRCINYCRFDIAQAEV